MGTNNSKKDANRQREIKRIGAWDKEYIEQCVEIIRLSLYNDSLPCGPKAIKRMMKEVHNIEPCPSIRTIARILSRLGLTHGRTGIYP